MEKNLIVYINADKVRICEVISNLLCNAIKFTSREAGRRSIMIKTEKEDSQARKKILAQEYTQKLCQSYFQNLLQIHLEEQE